MDNEENKIKGGVIEQKKEKIPRKKESDIRNTVFVLRLSPTEKEIIQSRMDALGYKSTAKFIRECVITQDLKVYVKRSPDMILYNEIGRLINSFNKYMTNYNETVKKFNTLCKLKKKDGMPFISTRKVFALGEEMNRNTVAAVGVLDKINNLVKERVEKEEKSGENKRLSEL